MYLVLAYGQKTASKSMYLDTWIDDKLIIAARPGLAVRSGSRLSKVTDPKNDYGRVSDSQGGAAIAGALLIPIRPSYSNTNDP